eukprot:TRINITY_DN2320_c1_g1_i2.p8 TRINITY_DN2320_c1_g1~~TRINITY_DN2320_c1_g1_i2.p8  ORF type:complete len:104 (-),score=11.51 TRINITY_DN2320_c1_g1_i2:301-612(-)
MLFTCFVQKKLVIYVRFMLLFQGNKMIAGRGDKKVGKNIQPFVFFVVFGGGGLNISFTKNCKVQIGCKAQIFTFWFEQLLFRLVSTKNSIVSILSQKQNINIK